MLITFQINREASLGLAHQRSHKTSKYTGVFVLYVPFVVNFRNKGFLGGVSACHPR
jgi:hypothetical protein